VYKLLMSTGRAEQRTAEYRMSNDEGLKCFAKSFLIRQNAFIRRSSVSFSIKLAAFQAGRWAET